MSVEFIGMIFHRPGEEKDGSRYGGEVDPEFIKTFARAHEDGGFDRVLIGYGSNGPDGWSIATWAAAYTERLGFLVAHRPGFVAPTLAARNAATLDALTGGRVAVHIVTGGNDAEQQRDGDSRTTTRATAAPTNTWTWSRRPGPPSSPSTTRASFTASAAPSRP